MQGNPNKCIQCSVMHCKHHTQSQNYCSLEKIQVGTHEPSSNRSTTTDCQSFSAK